MFANTFTDPDIIDYPELARTHGGHGVVDVNGRGYLAVPFDRPDRVRHGRRSLTEDQAMLRNAMCCWSLKAFHAAREFGYSPEDARAMVAEYCRVLAIDSAFTIGRRECEVALGMDARELALQVQANMRAAIATGGDAPMALLHAELATFANLGRAYTQSLSLDANIYEAFHGRLPGSYDDKIAVAFNTTEASFSLPVAAHLTMLTGVNMAGIWPQQHFYKPILDAVAALNDWNRFEPATLLLEDYYALFRCVQSVDLDDRTEHGEVKRFIAHQVDSFHGDRELFLDEAADYLTSAGLLLPPPQTMPELLRRCIALDDPGGQPRKFTVLPLAMHRLI